MNTLQKQRTFLFIEGIIFTLLGIGAIIWPLFSSMALGVMIGWIFFFCGLGMLTRLVSPVFSHSYVSSIILGVLFLLTGIMLIFFPLSGILTITFILGMLFITQGILQIYFGWRFREFAFFKYPIFNGILSLLIGIIIYMNWPKDSAWVLGTLIGVNLIVSGISYLMVASFLPKTPRK